LARPIFITHAYRYMSLASVAITRESEREDPFLFIRHSVLVCLPFVFRTPNAAESSNPFDSHSHTFTPFTLLSPFSHSNSQTFVATFCLRSFTESMSVRLVWTENKVTRSLSPVHANTITATVSHTRRHYLSLPSHLTNTAA
jgi:hypothetical protein